MSTEKNNFFAYSVAIRMAKIYPPKTLDLGSQAKVYNTLRIDHVFNTLRLDHVLYISKNVERMDF